MKERYYINFTKKQKDLLRERTKDLGFATVSEYIRYVLFVETSFQEKLDEIYKEVSKSA
jgi:hypothetical protein